MALHSLDSLATAPTEPRWAGGPKGIMLGGTALAEMKVAWQRSKTMAELAS